MNEVKEHMEVIGADGVHIGTVDRVENGKISSIRIYYDQVDVFTQLGLMPAATS